MAKNETSRTVVYTQNMPPAKIINRKVEQFKKGGPIATEKPVRL
jgi:hypothetical protein